jgi:GNAT superfamily N-acetyltransferase
VTETHLSGFRIRDLSPDDGPALDALIAASPDTGMIRFRPVFKVDPYVALTYGDVMSGVVVEGDGMPGLVGLGIVSYGELLLRGTRRPHALLHSLVVDPRVRRRGVARAIVASRLERARARLGDDGVVVATIQGSNDGSFAAASRWATQFSAPLDAVVLGTRRSAPSGRPEWRVRPAEEADLEAFADGFTAFRTDYDLAGLGDTEELAAWLDRTPTPGQRIHEFWVVEDGRGNLLGGLGLSEVRRSSILQVDALPWSFRALNAILRIIPRGGTMEQVPVTHLWFRPGSEAAGRHLFEVIRHEARRRGNVVLATYDPRGPLGRVVGAPRWLPRTSFTVALRASEALRPDHPIDPVQ